MGGVMGGVLGVDGPTSAPVGHHGKASPPDFPGCCRGWCSSLPPPIAFASRRGWELGRRLPSPIPAGSPTWASSLPSPRSGSHRRFGGLFSVAERIRPRGGDCPLLGTVPVLIAQETGHRAVR